MKRGSLKSIFAIGLMAAAFTFMFSGTSQAYYLNMDFFGKAIYNGKGHVRFPKKFVPDMDTQTFGKDPALRHFLNQSAPYYGVAMVDYRIDWDLPDWAQEQTWLLQVDVWAKGKVNGMHVKETYTGTFNLGRFSLEDVSGMTESEFAALLGTIPSDYYDPSIGGYYIDGDIHSGQAYAAIEQPFLRRWGIRTGRLRFGGNIRLSAIPEPMTMLLFGSGLFGLVGLRRKK